MNHADERVRVYTLAEPLPSIPWVPDYAWIQTLPVTFAQWRGSPIAVAIWSASCPACRRTAVWWNNIYELYAPRGVHFLAVHTPEEKADHDPRRVERVAYELGLGWPIVLDNRYDFWRSVDNRAWPTLYLADRLGQLRYRCVGLIVPGSDEAQRMQRWIEELIAEGT